MFDHDDLSICKRPARNEPVADKVEMKGGVRADRWDRMLPEQRHSSRRHFLSAASWTALGLLAAPFWTVSSAASQEKEDKQSLELSGSTTTGLVSDPRYLDHTMGVGHPESPERLRAILNQLKNSRLDEVVIPLVPSQDRDPMPHIRTVHPESHIKRVAEQAPDESICRLAVSGVLDAVDAVCTGEVQNAFCAVRPPGHHAANQGEFGFCFYNNIAIAARYAQRKYKLARILIVDWDYHHGDGTEWAFYDDPSVLFFSTHALYAFPGTGSAARTGKGAGKGFNINVPLPPGADDKAILKAFTERLLPAANSFRPDLVLISAGFDSRKDDLLGDFAVTDAGFAELTEIMMAIAREHCNARLVSVLEGGYNTRGLALAVESHLETLLKA
jgi:acetoin utilization deacetylase AcuC-like enzyme